MVFFSKVDGGHAPASQIESRGGLCTDHLKDTFNKKWAKPGHIFLFIFVFSASYKSNMN